ncbi:MAG: hypothetical protein ACRENZ_07335 [Thermodesulfobacteriota bacterium]
MNFREKYAEFSAREAVDAIQILLKNSGVEIDGESFTWTLVGVLFDRGIITSKEFENLYINLIRNKNGKIK